ncbi:hypothetical protein FOCC_FOCC004734 [Frankliniella occidentalis]|uniref:FAS-associated factor 2 n=1 Tax=Frankliniella occidentalis TaxID=133901 RepID=A0A6J1T3T0_FRAOC|nr:FAS-associated factor 2 [Frankliniella occidentalis]KAE8748558.1 hypothetical protein FOCC_FOCC004734 [Frankliniella occidentalis]
MDNLAMGLSSEQTDKILQLQDLTGIEDVTICRDVLTRHNWDLEGAVLDQLNIRDGHPSVFASSETHAPTVVNEPMFQHMFFSPPSGGYWFTRLYQFGYNLIAPIFIFAYRLLFRGDHRRYVTDPVADVMNFIRSYEENYGNQHPVFYQGSYHQALNDAKHELRFLIVYLHSDDHQDNIDFCRQVLKDESVIQYINTHMLFWGCNVNSTEGYKVSQHLRENAYPFLAVLAMRESRMTVVGRMEGPMNFQTLLQRLQTIVADNENCLVAARNDRMERSLNQTLRAQQDQAYEDSLQADREKERLRRLEKEKKEAAERERRESERQEQLEREEIQRQKVELACKVPAEPSSDHPESVHVVIKLPTGKRLERRFLQSHPLEAIFLFVFCHPEAPDRFEIATNFPKRVLQCENNTQDTLADVGLRRGEVLFVYDLEA